MVSVEAAREAWTRGTRSRLLDSCLTITDEGLVLGATMLAKMGRHVDGSPRPLIDDGEERIFALLAAAYGKAVGPAVLGNIRRASRCKVRPMAIVRLENFLSVFPGKRLRRAFLCATLIGSAVGIYYTVRFIELVITLGSFVGNHNTVEDSARNRRGDEVTVSTYMSGRRRDPERTVIRVRRTHHWFSSTLLEAESYGFRWGGNWRNDNTLDLNIGFGCIVHVTRPVTAVGSIHIIYHFTYDDETLDLDLARSGRSDSFACKAVHDSHGQNR